MSKKSFSKIAIAFGYFQAKYRKTYLSVKVFTSLTNKID